MDHLVIKAVCVCLRRYRVIRIPGESSVLYRIWPASISTSWGSHPPDRSPTCPGHPCQRQVFFPPPPPSPTPTHTPRIRIDPRHLKKQYTKVNYCWHVSNPSCKGPFSDPQTLQPEHDKPQTREELQGSSPTRWLQISFRIRHSPHSPGGGVKSMKPNYQKPDIQFVARFPR